MSKKKNTLKDLDEFLKQQAATLVSPERIGDKNEPERQEINSHVPEPVVQEATASISTDKLIRDLQQLSQTEGPRFRDQFYDLIIKTVESQNQYSGEDRVLINTALYLKSGEKWKEVIRQYWRNKNNK
jgi:hypothetical protein